MNQNPRDIKIPIIEYTGYYVDGTGLICYKSNGGFMYCKKKNRETTYIFHKGNKIEVNETEIANKYVIGWKENRKSANGKVKPIKTKLKDGRYKAGVDKGRMSTQTIELPLKPKTNVEKVEVVSNGDRQKMKQKSNKKIRTAQKLYKQVKQNIPEVISILKEMGYVISETKFEK